ncbi:MAG: tungstate transporter permease [Nitrospirae bacterium GWC2_57_13]|jgi:tungstate transport system permease protein|nr:MAG: tungstate transporter permease [Nitrospirae bacterium GWC1_57_7]OGW27007.1 MAG: tungstate transporter permease [Nitrospirae bacterium GWC2_57_13]OGW44241.1 MAG: tungstate transporter permease [Nitrospirae bacterium GWD2_57_8]HAS52799.1 tungstate transporter permease [Nitrospiraceae bacterium]
MESIAQGFIQAFRLILHLDAELFGIILLSLKVSGLALMTATLFGIPFGSLIGLRKFPGRSLVISGLNTFMGLPPVVVGLFVYLILSRKGPMGFLGLLYTPSAMVIAQTILALPIVAALCHSAIVDVQPVIRQAARTLGATPLQVTATVIAEARYGILSAVIAAFGRVMAEVGAILIVGGNIAGYTRVMTTTIALETDKGNFELALALGIILLVISFGINTALHVFQRKGIRGVKQWG